MTAAEGLRRAWQQGRGRHAAIAGAIASVTTFRLLPLQLPILTGAAVDVLGQRQASVYGATLPAASDTGLLWVALLLGVVALAQGVAGYLSRTRGSKVGAGVGVRLRLDTIDAWLHAPLSLHRGLTRAELHARTFVDVRTARRYVEAVLVGLPSLVLRTVYPVAILWWIHPGLAVVPIAALPLQWVIVRGLRGGITRAAGRVRRAKGRFQSRVRETLDGIESLRGLGAEAGRARELSSLALSLERRRHVAHGRQGLLTGGMWLVTAGTYAATWWVGGHLVLDGVLSIGALVTFTGFVRYTNLPLREIGRYSELLRRGVRAFDRLERLAAQRPGEDVSRAPVLQLREVEYHGTRGRVLGPVSLSFPRGSVTLLRGASGSGKSTLLAVVAGLLSPANGEVVRDEAAAAPPDAERCVLVSQQLAVFGGSVADNLRLAHPEASDAALEEACRQVGLSSLIEALPDGLATTVGPGGVPLSGGEQRRLAIARALTAGRGMLLLDEPCVDLDRDGAERLAAALARLGSRWTLVVADSSGTFLPHASQVVTLERGLAPSIQHVEPPPTSEVHHV